MKLRMLVSKPGSIDGILIQIYEQGEEYDLPPDLAHAFLGLSCAQPIEESIPGAIGEVEYPQVEFVSTKKKSVKRKKR